MKKFQIVGIGNAMVDVLTRGDELFLAEAGIEKGIMQLIDMDRAVSLYGAIGPAKEISGGSAANTIAGIAHLGGRTAYVGKVKDDQLGAIFAHDLRAQGAVYETSLAAKATDLFKPINLRGNVARGDALDFLRSWTCFDIIRQYLVKALCDSIGIGPWLYINLDIDKAAVDEWNEIRRRANSSLFLTDKDIVQTRT